MPGEDESLAASNSPADEGHPESLNDEATPSEPVPSGDWIFVYLESGIISPRPRPGGRTSALVQDLSSFSGELIDEAARPDLDAASDTASSLSTNETHVTVPLTGLFPPPLGTGSSSSPPVMLAPPSPPPSPPTTPPATLVGGFDGLPEAVRLPSPERLDLEVLRKRPDASVAAISTRGWRVGYCQLCEIAAQMFRCLRIGGVVEIFGLLYSEMSDWLKALVSAGFHGIDTDFPYSSKTVPFQLSNLVILRGIKPTYPIPTFRERNHHDGNAHRFARSRFVKHAMDSLTNGTGTLEEVRELVSCSHYLRTQFEAAYFRSLLNNCVPGARLNFGRYLRHLGGQAYNCTVSAPRHLLWILDPQGVPPMNGRDELPNVAFCRLLLECAGGPESDLPDTTATEEDIEVTRQWSMGLRRDIGSPRDGDDSG